MEAAMTIIEIKKGIYLNVENVFKFELLQKEDNSFFFRFYSHSEQYADSHDFANLDLAKEWISMRIIRAAGADEILGL